MDTKILLVEDDQFLREMYVELLRDEGIEVVACADGEEGYARASEGGYSLIMLDIMIPKMDGLQILKKLNEEGGLSKNGPVVLITNLEQDNIIQEGYKLGASGYLVKSALTPDQVLHEIRTFLSGSKKQ
jgi:two-component system, OmpR family, response regulator